MLLLLAHAAATCALVGLAWVVQVVVYPSFRVVGPTPAWATFHARHSVALARVVALPWVTHGATCALLLLARPPAVPAWAALLAAGLGLATVLLTVGWAVPLHTALGRGYQEGLVRRLLVANAWRTLAWTAAAVLALGLLARVATA